MRCPGEVAVRCKSPGAARRNRWNGTVTLIACLTLAAASANGDDDLAYTHLRQALVQSLAGADKQSAKRAVSALRSTGLFERLSEADQSFLQSEL